jgi:hypothetical protein
MNALFNKKEKRTLIDSESSKYMINMRNSGFFQTSLFSSVVIGDNVNDGDESSSSKESKRIAVKPIEVFNELERLPTTWSLEGLDDKIAITEDKISLASSTRTKEELILFLFCLKNRKKYNSKDKNGNYFSQFYLQFDTTNESNIKKLTEKYKLRMGEADLFIPELPSEAIKTMKLFSEKTEELCGKKPIFYIIAEEKDFSEIARKRDPILLAQSPFGLYFYILGAWDKEMLMLSEL